MPSSSVTVANSPNTNNSSSNSENGSVIRRPCRYRPPNEKDVPDIISAPKIPQLPKQIAQKQQQQLLLQQKPLNTMSRSKDEVNSEILEPDPKEENGSEATDSELGSVSIADSDDDDDDVDLKLELEPDCLDDDDEDDSGSRLGSSASGAVVVNQSRLSSRDSMSIDVIDEFVSDDLSLVEEQKQEEEMEVASITSSEPNESISNGSIIESNTLTTTKSGRKVSKPKVIHFGLAAAPGNEGSANTSGRSSTLDFMDSETEEEVAIAAAVSVDNVILSAAARLELDKSIPCKYQQGELAWARLGLAPYWPCTITDDPDSNVHTSVTVRGKKGLREYHVQFFGRVQHAWVKDACLMRFEGVEAFQARVEEVKQMPPAAQKKLIKAFVPMGASKTHWSKALEKMKEVINMDNEGRHQKAKRLLEEAALARANQKIGEKRKHLSSSSSLTKSAEDVSTQSESTPLVKRPKVAFPEADSLIRAIPAEVLEENRRKLKSGFKLFKLALLDKVGTSEKTVEVDRKVTKMWNQLGRAERQFYCDEALKISSSSENLAEDDVSEETEVVVSKNDKSAEDKALKSPKQQNVTSSPSAEKAAKLKQSSGPANNNNNMIGVFKKESCCTICEESNQTDLLKCRGICQNSYHISCLNLEKKPDVETWKCETCISGIHPCLLCKSIEGDRVRCSVSSCGKFYHRACLKTGMWPQARVSETSITCPAHTCHTCAADDPADPVMKYNTTLLRCVRCPTSYHAGDYCITAGSIQLTATQIVCPKHYVPPKSKKGAATHINTSWCFMCSAGGTLYCCELCPASFHAECLKIDPPEGLYYCNSCETGQMPLYGEVLWVKLGNYRWWPARVLHPREVPDNIERLPHDIGEFPIQFCGTKEYFWMNRGRCFPYQEGDSDKIPGVTGSSSSSLEVSFRRGLKEAAEWFEEYSKGKSEREAACAKRVLNTSSAKPPTFTRIKGNKPFGDCPVYTSNPLDHQVCDCDPKAEEPCGKDSDCINRYLMVECSPSTCPASDRCGNMQFQRRVYPRLTVSRTASRGWGLFIKEPVKKGSFLIEYVGELITMDEFKKRMAAMMAQKDGEQNYYYMVMDNSRVIDAGPRGNIARFMNHSCSPNCETQKWTVNGDTRIGLFALEDIPAGTELTFNYQLEAFGDVKKPCLCGAKNCSGFIGEKPTKVKNGSNANGINGHGSKSAATAGGGKKKKLKAVVKKVWEDHCFRCFQDGEVIMCDYKNCPKVYHLNCVEQEKLPRGEWLCPWHFCVVCAKSATQRCLHCPNAYCKAHAIGAISSHPTLSTICDEHKDDIGDLLLFYMALAEPVEKILVNPNLYPEKLKSLNFSKSKLTTPKSTQVQSSIASAARKPITPVASEVKQELSSERSTERLFKCPGCNGNMRASLIRRHIQARHPELYESGGFNSTGEELSKRLNAIAVQAKIVKENDLTSSPKIAKDEKGVARRHTMSTFTSVGSDTPSSDACVKCPAPDCNKFVHHTNLSRHWRHWHPSLDRAKFPGQQELLKTTDEPKINRRLSDSELIPTVTDHPSSPSLVTSLPMVNGQYACRYRGCDYLSKYNSNMWRHRRKYGHHINNEEDLIAAESAADTTTTTTNGDDQEPDGSKTAKEETDVETEDKAVEEDMQVDEEEEDEEVIINRTALVESATEDPKISPAEMEATNSQEESGQDEDQSLKDNKQTEKLYVTTDNVTVSLKSFDLTLSKLGKGPKTRHLRRPVSRCHSEDLSITPEETEKSGTPSSLRARRQSHSSPASNPKNKITSYFTPSPKSTSDKQQRPSSAESDSKVEMENSKTSQETEKSFNAA